MAGNCWFKLVNVKIKLILTIGLIYSDLKFKWVFDEWQKKCNNNLHGTVKHILCQTSVAGQIDQDLLQRHWGAQMLLNLHYSIQSFHQPIWKKKFVLDFNLSRTQKWWINLNIACPNTYKVIIKNNVHCMYIHHSTYY